MAGIARFPGDARLRMMGQYAIPRQSAAAKKNANAEPRQTQKHRTPSLIRGQSRKVRRIAIRLARSESNPQIIRMVQPLAYSSQAVFAQRAHFKAKRATGMLEISPAGIEIRPRPLELGP